MQTAALVTFGDYCEHERTTPKTELLKLCLMFIRPAPIDEKLASILRSREDPNDLLPHAPAIKQLYNSVDPVTQQQWSSMSYEDIVANFVEETQAEVMRIQAAIYCAGIILSYMTPLEIVNYESHLENMVHTQSRIHSPNTCVC